MLCFPAPVAPSDNLPEVTKRKFRNDLSPTDACWSAKVRDSLHHGSFKSSMAGQHFVMPDNLWRLETGGTLASNNSIALE